MIANNRIHLYPTITADQFTIEGLEIGERVDLLDGQGMIIKSFIMTSVKQDINVSNLSQGQYYVRPTYGQASRFIKI